MLESAALNALEELLFKKLGMGREHCGISSSCMFFPQLNI